MLKNKNNRRAFIVLSIIGAIALVLFGWQKASPSTFSYCSVYAYRTMAFFDLSYEKDKKLVEPYFDDAFYRQHYAKELQETGLSPIDHYMTVGWRGDWQTACDPNGWFNVTLYKERLWPTSDNPLIDFLKQSPKVLPANAESVDIYVTQADQMRAWMAVEAFLRQNKFQPVIVLSRKDYKEIPLYFKPQMARGLQVRFSDDPGKSFYKSPFLKKPEIYVADLVNYPQRFDGWQPIVYVPKGKKIGRSSGHLQGYLFHHMYRGTRWYKKGLLNPLMLNFGKYSDEPLLFSPFGKTEEAFRKRLRRVAPGFDVIFTGIELDTPNNRIIPGYMKTWVSPDEKPKDKIFEVSYLLTLGGKGPSNFGTGGAKNYYMRQDVWDAQKDIHVPMAFYISKLNLDKYPKEMHHRAIPDGTPGDPKHWIFRSQFNIAIENTRQRNYFTEKLLGCFVTLTVPIYIGCPNVGDYFDTRGMLIAKDAADAVRIANAVTPELYAKMLPFVKENKKRTEALMGLLDREIGQFIAKRL